MPPQSSPTVPVTIVSSKPLTSAVPPFVSPQTTTPGAVTIVSSKPLAGSTLPPMTVAPSFDLASAAAQTGPTQIPQRLNQPPVVPQVEITPGEVPSPLSTPALDHFIALAAGGMSAMQTGNVLADAASNLSGGRLSRETARAFVPFTTPVSESDQARAQMEAMKSAQTPALRAAQQQIGEAKTWGEAWQTLKANPMLATTSVAESLPGMAVGMATGSLVGRMIPALAAKAPWVAGGLGEGFVTGVQNLDQVMQANQGKPLTLKQLAAVSGSALLTAAIGAVGGKVAAKLGFVDLETMLVAAQRNPELRLSVTKAVLFGAAQEGLFEELPQSWQEQIAQNIANGRPMLEGTPGAGVLGGAAGGLTGGGINLAVGGAVKLKPRSSADLEYVRSASDDALLADIAKVTQDDLASPVAMTTVAELTRRGMSGPDLVLRVRELKAQAQAAASAEQESALAAQDAVSTPPAPAGSVSGESKSAPGTLTPPPEIAPQNAATEATGEPAWTPPSESAQSAATPSISSSTSSAVQPPAQASPSATPSVLAQEKAQPAVRSLQKTKLDTPIVGPTGASIIGYEWRSKMGEKFIESKGETVEARVSDWDRKDTSGGTGRDIVHVFHVAHPDGTVTLEGVNSAERILGIPARELRSKAAKERQAREYQATLDQREVRDAEKAAFGTVAEASRQYRQANYSSMRSTAENDAVFDRSVLLEKDGKFLRVGPHRVALLTANGWSEAPSVLAQSAAASKASFDAKQAAKQTDSPEFKAWFGESKVVDEQGKPRVVYHGTSRAGFDTFDTASSDLGSHFSVEPAVGNLFAADQAGKNAVYPVHLKVENPLRMRDLGRWGDREIIAELKKQNLLSEKTEDDFYAGKFGPTRTHEQATAATQRLLKSLGYDGIVYLNRREAVVGDETKIPAERWGRLLGVGKANENATKTSDRWSNTATDEEFLREVPEARDAYIVFDPSQVKSAIGNRGTFDASKPSILEQKGGRIDEGRAMDALLKALPPSEEPGVGGALENLLGSVDVELGSDGRSLLWDSGSYRNDFNRSYNSQNLKPITVAKLRDLLQAERDNGNDDADLATALAAISPVEAKPSTPQPEGKRESFTRAALRRVFGYGKDVASATSKVAEAMGLPINRMLLQKGGMPAKDALQSVKFWREKGRAKFAKNALKHGHPRELVEDALRTVDDIAGMMARYPEIFPQQSVEKQGAWTSNRDFINSLDADRVCTRVLKYWANVDAIQNEIGGFLSPEQMLRLGQQMLEDGDIAGCVYCYGEAGRRAGNRNVVRLTTWDLATAKREMPKSALPAKIERRDTLLKKLGWSLEDFAAFAVNQDRTAKALLRPESAEAELAGLVDFYWQRGGGYDMRGLSDYRHEVISAPQEKIDATNERAGARIQSLTDFNPMHAIEKTAFVQDAAVRKLMAHEYTKEVLSVIIYGDTGIKQNISIAANIDPKTGKMVEDVASGVPWEQMSALRDRYKHAGSMLMIKNFRQLLWALDAYAVQRKTGKPDPRAGIWIDMGIPHHAAYWDGGVESYRRFGLDNFDQMQHEHWADESKAPVWTEEDAPDKRQVGKPKTPGDVYGNKLWFNAWLKRHKGNEEAAVADYLKFCAKNGIVPKWDSGNYADHVTGEAKPFPSLANWQNSGKPHPGYALLLKDYARTDTPQVPLDARGIDKGRMMTWVEDFAKEGGWRKQKSANPKTVKKFVALLRSGKDLDVAGTQLRLDAKGLNLRGIPSLDSLGISLAEASVRAADKARSSVRKRSLPVTLAQSPSVLFQDNPAAADTWYYDNVVESLKGWQNKGTSQQLLAHLGKTKGALEEAEDIGFVAWLKARPNVTKAEAQAYVDQHKVVLEETVLGGEGIHGESWDPEIAILREEGYDIDGDPVDDESLPFLITRAGEQIDDLPIGPDGRIDVDKLELMRRAEWASGDAIHVPDRAVEAFNRIIDKQEQEYRQGGGGLEYEGYQAIKGGTNPREILLKLPITPETDARRSRADYVAPHYSGANAQNLLLHTRVWDYTLPDGRKILVAKEIQSDWHQAGRKQGYQGDTDAKIAELDEKIRARMRELPTSQERLNDAEWNGLTGAYNGLVSKRSSLIPQAPFKGHAWKRLALKRLLAYAAEGGYDGVGWTTGAQQADLYDLSKQISKIELRRYPAASGHPHQYDLTAYDLGGNKVIGKRGLREDDIEEHVGKEPTEKLLTGENAERLAAGIHAQLEGLDLKVGGTGMVGFYDRELVNLANDLAKKHGQRTSEIRVPTDEVPGAPEGLAKVGINEKPVPKGVEINHNGWSIVMTDGTKWGIWSKKLDASAALERLKADPLSLSHPKTIHFLPTPPVMRAEIAAKKQALYQGVPADAQASVEFYDEAGYTQAIIRALNNPNSSSALHEIAHVARRFLLNRDVPLEQRLGVDEADIVEAEKFCGVKDGAWTVKAEERFARAFERYMHDGISPSPKLTKVFNAFAKWLTQVYATIKGSPIDIEITPEMRSVFDRLMTRSERLAQKGEAQQQFEERKAQPRNAAPRQTQKRPDHQKRQPEMTLASLAQ